MDVETYHIVFVAQCNAINSNVSQSLHLDLSLQMRLELWSVNRNRSRCRSLRMVSPFVVVYMWFKGSVVIWLAWSV